MRAIPIRPVLAYPGQFWGRRSLVERLAMILIPAAMVAAVVTAVVLYLAIPPLLDFLGANFPLIRFFIAATAILVLTIPTAFVLIYLELKVIARMNLRVGPNRVGPWGIAMSLMPGLKVLSKEDFTPTGADATVFTLAPVVTFLASVMTLLVIPFAPGVVGLDLNIGLLYFFAMGGLTVLGLLMPGNLVADTMAVMASLDPIMGGVDK